MNKRMGKRIISFLLSFIMVLSTLTPAMEAKAEETNGNTTTILTHQYVKVNVTNPDSNSWHVAEDGATTGAGGPGFAFDEDTNSFWHSNYTETDDSTGNKKTEEFDKLQETEIPTTFAGVSNRIYIGGAFGKEVNLKKFVYQQRQAGNYNGIGQWALYTANVTNGEPVDDDDFTTLAATGSFENTRAEFEVELDKVVTATHFRLVTFSFYNNFATASNIEMYEAEEVEMEVPVAPHDYSPSGTTQNQPFGVGTGGSNNFRIPCITTIEHDGKERIVAAADMRWNHDLDGRAIDLIVSYSDDQGATWNYTSPMYFNDSVDPQCSDPNQEWVANDADPKFDYAATIMDPVMVADNNNNLYILADLFPGGVAIENAVPLKPEATTGYENIEGTDRLVLYASPEPGQQDENNYTHYVGDYEDGYAPVYDKTTKEVKYYIDEEFDLFDVNKEPIYCRQIGSENNGLYSMVRQNIFYYNADLHVRCATYLVLVKSTDGGETWSKPYLINNQVSKGTSKMFYGTGPGTGMVMENGMLIFPMYEYSPQYSSLIFSTDGGQTWKRTMNSTSSQWSSESVLVKLSETKLRQFMRTGNSVLSYVDWNWDATQETWITDQQIVTLSQRVKDNNQLSAYMLDETFQGKPVIIVSAATTNSSQDVRADGRIYTFAVNSDENNTMEFLTEFDVWPVGSSYPHGVNYADGKECYTYSSMTETEDGKIALLVETDFKPAKITYRLLTKEEACPGVTFDDGENLGFLKPKSMASTAAKSDVYLNVDDMDTEPLTVSTNYFVYEGGNDNDETPGAEGWAWDYAGTAGEVAESVSRHYFTAANNQAAQSFSYTLYFKGTGVDLIGHKAASALNIQLDGGAVEKIETAGNTGDEVILCRISDLEDTTHTLKVTVPEGTDTALEVTGARVYGEDYSWENLSRDVTVVSFKKIQVENELNAFRFSGGWADGNDNHRWTGVPSAAGALWYEVDFMGSQIDIYAGKNQPHGDVKYTIYERDAYAANPETAEPVMGPITISLWRNGNVDSMRIWTFKGLEERKAYTFRAEATKTGAGRDQCIDCANVIVYHEPYEVTGVALEEPAVSLFEGSTKQINYSVTPSHAYLKDVTYTSANTAVATVDNNGVITAVAAGATTISMAAVNMTGTKEIEVTVKETVPLVGAIVDTDTQWTQARYNEVKELENNTSTLTVWKNDKAVSEIALASVGRELEDVTITVSDLVNGDKTIAASNVTATFVKSTKAYNGGYLGYGDPNRQLPADNGTNRSESSDILYQTTPIDIPNNSVQPVWVEFDIPKDVEAGTYTGTVTVTAKDINEPLTFTYTVNVQDATLADATEFKDGFDIELWQYPYSSAEYYGVTPFSEKHYEIMESSMEIYKEIGGHAITTSIVEEAWSGQTYSKNAVHYPSMVKWNKQADGSFTWDYTDFDKWVTFCKEMGIGDKIVLYSIAPWNGSIGYWQNGTLTYQGFNLGNTSDQNIWKAFLRDLIDHLTEKGWFEDAYMGIDERGFSKAAFDLIDSVQNIHAKPLKTAGAMDGFVDKWDLALRVTDLNVGDTAAAAHPAEFKELLAAREAKGYRTTLYSCTEHQPGNFSLSAPVESYWAILNAGMMDTAGFLRWAYDAWVEDPLRDATHNAFEPGDCFLIYPDEKDAVNPTSKSSVRLERMAEGVRDVNKLLQMKEEVPSLATKVDEVFANIQYNLTTSRSYLSAAGVAQLRSETAAFKQELNALTKEYITLKATGTNEVENVTIAQGEAAEVSLGNTLQLTANVTPDTLLNNRVIWTSSNTNIATVDANGQVTAVREGTVTITAKAVADETKTAQIEITVTGVKIEESKQVAYYSFDNITDTTVENEWGSRDGQMAASATTAKGKQGNALYVTEAGNGVTVDGENTLTGDWTVSYWVKTTSTFDKEISVLENANKTQSLSLKMAADRDSGFREGDGSGEVYTFAYAFQKDTWYHIAWTKDEDVGLRLYVNGQFVKDNSGINRKSIKAPYDIIGGTGFTGLIDEVKVYSAVLTPEEIAASMQVEGINLATNAVTMYIDDTYSLNASVVTDNPDKTITYTSSDETVATVSADGVITALKKGTAVITVSAAGYEETVEVTVTKEVSIRNELTIYELDDKYLSDVDKPDTSTEEGRSKQYLGQPDMVRTSTGRLITSYPQGHGKGPLIMKISDDNGETWTKKTDIPSSWAGSQETPTLYVLNLSDGTERIMMITACPGWGTDNAGYSTGWNTSYSDDNGDTWTEYKHWHTKLPDGSANAAVVAMASLIQLKDENGNYIDQWMGVYHLQSPFKNYKSILSFDENGNEQWSEPEWYLEEHSSIETARQMCEIGMFRSPDGNRIVGLARTQSHNNYATLIYSDDEGKTWSEPMDLPGSLAGERHKAVYDPISGRLVITFREIRYDLNGNNKFENGDWICDDWGVWVGTYEDLMNQEPGDYRIRIEEDWAQNTYKGDTGYAGLVTLEDGTLIMDSYGHWDREYSENWGFGKVTTDLCYIKQAKFKLADIENANGLVDYSELEEVVAEVKDTVNENYSVESWKSFEDALKTAKDMLQNRNVQQVEVNAAVDSLVKAVSELVPAEKPGEDDNKPGVSDNDPDIDKPVVNYFTVSFKNGTDVYEFKSVSEGSLLINVEGVKDIAAPVKEGYNFLGWFADKAQYDLETFKVSGDLTLTAQWLKQGDFNKNEGDNQILADKVVDGTITEVADQVWVAGVENLTYTGKKQTFPVRVYDGTRLLTEKKDYTVSFKNNQNAGGFEGTLEELAALEAKALQKDKAGKDAKKILGSLPQVIIKLKGDYKGTKTLYFKILPKSISDNDIVMDDIFVKETGKAQKVKVVATWNGKKLGAKDFTVTTPEGADLTKATKIGEPIKVTVTGNKNFTGTREVNFTIFSKENAVDMSKVKVTLPNKGKVTWTEAVKDGFAFSISDNATDKESVVVKNGKNTVSVNSFSVSYENNKEAGKATMILRGDETRGFFGIKRVTFQIVGTDLKNFDTSVKKAAMSYAYEGQEIRPLEDKDVKIVNKKDPKDILELGKDYEVTYSKNTDKGTATMVVTGNPKEGYVGSKKFTFKITAVPMTDDSVVATFTNGKETISANVMAGGAKPQVVVSYKGTTLTEGKDYTLAYKNNKAGAKKVPTVTISGKGNFSGKDSLDFTLQNKPINTDGITVVIKDKEADIKKGKWLQSFKVYDEDGKALKAGVDYEKTAVYEQKVVSGNSVSYNALDAKLSEIKEAVTIRVTIKGMGHYTGQIQTEYRILAANHDISKAKFKVANMEYTGNVVTISANDFTQAEVGKKGSMLQLIDKDEKGNITKVHFTIDEDSYQKNDKKGTAKVTLRGTGDFGGEKTITFKIVERNVETQDAAGKFINWWETLMDDLLNKLFGKM